MTPDAGDGAVEPLLAAAGIGYAVSGAWLFTDLDLSVTPGLLVEVRGANGSGKSTLLRCLAGLVPPGAGTVERRAKLAYLGHRSGLCGSLTPAENLRWLQSQRGVRDDVTIAGALARYRLDRLADRPVQTLSAGQRRRVSLAGVLAAGAGLWLLDEPLTSLDEGAASLFATALGAHLACGGGAVAATHRDLGAAAGRRLEIVAP